MPTGPVTFTPSGDETEALLRAARAYGIEPEYWDIFGRRHAAGPGVQRAILKSLGVPSDSLESLDQALEDRLWRSWAQMVPPTFVTSRGGPGSEMPFSVPESHSQGRAQAEIVWEDGHKQKFDAALAALRTSASANLRGQTFVRKQLPLPPSAKLGYHELKIRVEAAGVEPLTASVRLIVCPERAYDPPCASNGRKTAGVCLSLYGVRSRRNWGCGDFTDLERLIDWVHDGVGGSFLGLNPLHALANRAPYNTSPYLPQCTFYRNPIYLDLERIEDFRECAASMLSLAKVRAEIAALRAADFVEYERVNRLKMRLLRVAFRRFMRLYRANPPRVQAFKTFIESEGRMLDLFATHSALDEVMHRENPEVWNWPSWPAEYRDPDSPAIQQFRRKHWRRILFHKYIQWQVDLQLAAAQQYARRKGLGIGLYHDLALATDRFGCDLWAFRDFYVAGCRVGAPPDDFSPNGQDWSFPPPDTERHLQDGYRLFVASIRQNCRHGGALRIDHVMRFFRLYWIPDGVPATHGTYVREHWEDLVRILALESVRNQVLVVGEDLGTVEPEIRKVLHKYGIRGYRLFYFERDDRRNFKTPDEYPPQALVSATTHDLPTLAGFWAGRDIEARVQAGLLDAAGAEAQRRDRLGEKQKMLELLIRLELLPDWFPRQAAAVPELTGDLHNAIIGFLASTPSELLAINQEDITKGLDQQNLPGSTAEYPNWRRKMDLSVEDLQESELARNCTSMVRGWIERAGRC